MNLSIKLVELVSSFNEIKSSIRGKDFLIELSKRAGRILEVDYVSIGRGIESNTVISTDVVIGKGQLLENFDYKLKDTPCETVFTNNRTCTYADQVDVQFSKDLLLSQMGIKSYVGSNIYFGDDFFGVFVLLDTKPIPQEKEALLIAACEFLAVRVSLEYRTMNSERNFRASEEFLNRMLREKEFDLHQSHDLLKSNNIKLKKLVDEKHNLLSTILHDISNPLMAATSNLGLSPVVDSDRYVQNAEDALNEVIKITGHIRQAYKAGISGKPRPKKEDSYEEVYLRDMVKYARLVFQDKLEKKNLDIKISKGEDLSFNTDSVSFKNSVFNNLISNAIKFSPRDSCIEIRAEVLEGKLELEIRDHGVGIPKGILEQINSGVSVMNSSLGTQGEEGTGLGIRSAIDYVKNLGGSIKFKNLNSAGGQGTNICISLN